LVGGRGFHDGVVSQDGEFCAEFFAAESLMQEKKEFVCWKLAEYLRLSV
jgi:hypothetical protein